MAEKKNVKRRKTLKNDLELLKEIADRQQDLNHEVASTLRRDICFLSEDQLTAETWTTSSISCVDYDVTGKTEHQVESWKRGTLPDFANSSGSLNKD